MRDLQCLNMRSNPVPLPDVILQEAPEVLDLHCYEEIEEEVEQGPIIEPYEVQVNCGLCEDIIVFFVAGTTDSIRTLQQELLGNLRLVCGSCALNFNHG